MKLARVLFMLVLLGFGYSKGGLVTPVFAETVANPEAEELRCIAFSPYVGNLDPNTGPHPSRALIRTLLNKIVQETSFRCIMTYGVLHGLDYTFKAAQARGLKVIAILWLDEDIGINDRSIEKGIKAAKAYPETIIRLSCGSEVRSRHGNRLDAEILKCIERLRGAGVTQPITTIDTWWEWCVRPLLRGACYVSDLTPQVDWIGINVFPWWENKFSGLYPCTPAKKAAAFHIARLQEVMAAYPDKEVILTEFGWPAGPRGYRETNRFTGQRCGVANSANQDLVIKKTLAKLNEKGWPGVVFEAFREPWKVIEGPVGPFWGICKKVERTYKCKDLY